MTEDNFHSENELTCPECGRQVERDDEFCPSCGTKLQSETGSPDDAVLLKTFPDEDSAKQAIKNLEANKINASTGLKPWSNVSSDTDVLVRRADLNRAREVIILMQKSSKPMQLGDIFSNGFTFTGKCFRRNVFIAALFIPAAIILTLGLKSLISAIPSIDEKIVDVRGTTAERRDIKYEFSTTGKIDSAFNVVCNITYADTSAVTVNDTAWVGIGGKHPAKYLGMVSDVQVLHTPDNEDELYAAIKLFEPDTLLTAGAEADITIIGDSAGNVLSIPSNFLVYNNEEDSLEEGKEYVYTVENNKAKLKEVKSGIYDDDYTEIKEGLSVGETVITETADGKPIKNGTEVLINGDISSAAAAMKIFGNMFLFFAAVLAVSLISLLVTVGVTKTTLTQMNGESFTLSDAYRKMFSVTTLKCIGLTLLLFLIIISAAVVIGILMAAGAGVSKAFGVILILAVIPAGIYLYIKWHFSYIAIIDSDAGIVESLKQSSYLVKDYWWRTFGIIILITLAINFMVSVITTPATFVFMWGYISQSFKNPDAASDPSKSLQMLQSLGWGFALTIMLSYFLEALIAPVFKVVIYNDLKTRKNEIIVKLPEEEQPQQEQKTGE